MGDGQTNVAPRAESNRCRDVDIALAEFVALRAEILERISAIERLAGLGFTALAVIVGLWVKDDGDVRLLLAIAPLALLINVRISTEHRRMVLAGTYIRHDLWTTLRSHASGPMTCWEDHVHRRRRGWDSVITAVSDSALIGSFALAAIIGIILARDSVSGVAECLEWAVAVASALAPLTIGLSTRAAVRNGR